jgi:hypothetical protein
MNRARITVVPEDEAIPAAVIESIQWHAPSQILVTGKGAFNLGWMHGDRISQQLRGTWELLRLSELRSSCDSDRLLQQFAQGVASDPSRRRICFTPTAPHEPSQYLFWPSPRGPYSAAILVINITGEQPVSYLEAMGHAVSGADRAPGYVQCIFSLSDLELVSSTADKLRTALESGGRRAATEAALQYLRMIEHGKI